MSSGIRYDFILGTAAGPLSLGHETIPNPQAQSNGWNADQTVKTSGLASSYNLYLRNDATGQEHLIFSGATSWKVSTLGYIVIDAAPLNFISLYKEEITEGSYRTIWPDERGSSIYVYNVVDGGLNLVSNNTQSGNEIYNSFPAFKGDMYKDGNGNDIFLDSGTAFDSIMYSVDSNTAPATQEPFNYQPNESFVWHTYTLGDQTLNRSVKLVNGSLYAEASQLAVEAYTDTASATARGWRPISAPELGISATSALSDPVQYSFHNGVYRAVVPAVRGGESNAILLTGLIDGKLTLAISFRGTDSISDILDYFPFQDSYSKLKPLTDAVLHYVKKAGIEKVLVSGHSLGGALAQIFTTENIGVTDVDTFTFGSPGANEGAGTSFSTNFIHTLDPVPLLGSAKFDYNVGGNVFVHSVEAAIDPYHQHASTIYASDTNRIVTFARDASSALFNTPLGKSVASNVAYIGPAVQIMPGTEVSDTMYSSSADNYVLGGSGDDTVVLTINNLLPTSSGGERTVDGGIGGDTLRVHSLSFLYRHTATDPGEYNIASLLGLPVANIKSVETLSFLNGDISFTPDSTGGKVYALYSGLLGRAPDSDGLSYWADKIDGGTAVRDLSQSLLSSSEGQLRLGAFDDTNFVQQLYANTLHREADAEGLAYWTNLLAEGAARVDVADNFVFSDEHVSNIQPALSAGILVPDLVAADVARVYYTMLGRAPDADGLGYWRDQIDQGGTLSGVTAAFLGTPENQSKYGSIANSDYVDALYVNAVGRHADSEGLAYWTDLLNKGASRADLGTLLAQSAEAKSVHLNEIELGWHLA